MIIKFYKYHIDKYPLAYRARILRDRVKDTGGINLNIIMKAKDGYGDVWLTGPAEKAFEGEFNL